MARIGILGRPWLGGEGPPASSPLRHWRARARLAAIPALSLVLLFALAGQASAAGTLLQISSDPYTGSGTSGQHRTQVEPDSLSAGNTIVSAFQSGRVFNGGASNIGFATSHDGGKTFVHGFLPGTTTQATPAGPYQRASDVSVAFDARDNVWILSYLLIPAFPIPGSPPFVDVFVSRSTDGGLTWGMPIPVAAPHNIFFDKNWSVCDNTPTSPFFGNCYTEYDNVNLFDLEQMSTSTNGGLTWGPGKATADGAHGLGGQPLVQPNGHVVVPFVGLDSPIFLFTISAFVSVDGGASWSAQNQIAPAVWAPPAGGIRAGIPLPSAEIDGSGKVYVAWSDCRFRSRCALGNVTSDIVFSTSSDGTTWSPVARIPSDPVASTVDHFVPGLAVDNSTAGSKAHLAVAYYFYPNGNCTPTSCQLEVGFSASTNAGKTWTAGKTLAGPMSLSWLAATSQGRMVGDYISTSIVNGAKTASPFFAVAGPNSGSVFNEALFTIAGGESLKDGSHASGSDPVLSMPVSKAAMSAALGMASSTTRAVPTDF